MGIPWWRHQMETCSVLLSIFTANRRWPMNSPHKGQYRGPLFFYICALNKRLSTQSWGWWFEMPSRSLWRHCNASNDAIKSGRGKFYLRHGYIRNYNMGSISCILHTSLHYTFTYDSVLYKAITSFRWWEGLVMLWYVHFQTNFNNWRLMYFWWISFWKLSLELGYDKSILVQVMAWCRQATIRYFSQFWPSFMSPCDVINPQWVKQSNTILKT